MLAASAAPEEAGLRPARDDARILCWSLTRDGLRGAVIDVSVYLHIYIYLCACVNFHAYVYNVCIRVHRVPASPHRTFVESKLKP